MIWLIGNKGMLGTQLEKTFQAKNIDFIGSDREVDITDFSAIESFASGRSVNMIINCSAYTAVDKAESEPELAKLINEDGVRNLARYAKLIDADMVHFSTDYVFGDGGSSPMNEGFPTAPQSVYGRTKLGGETAILEEMTRFYILRISWLYGVYGKNFVKTMIRLMDEKERLTVVSDQIGSPTYCGTLTENIADRLVTSVDPKYGIYHYSDDAVISWFDFAVEIQNLGIEFGLLDRRIPVEPIPTSAYPTPAKRPAYSVMDTTKIQREFGFKVNDWRESLRAYFEEWKAVGFE